MIYVEEPYFLKNEEWYVYEDYQYKLTDKAPKKARESYEEFYKKIEATP